MAVSVDVGGEPVDAGRVSRRGVLRGLPASAAALALAALATASRRAGADAFGETYRGRRIAGVRAAAGSGWRVTVDGRALHLMRRADGSWLSMVDHYCSYPTPLTAARAAVDALGPGRQLRDPAAHLDMTNEGAGHGVHA
ncbi:tyrosinase family oxidase copper chaperone [Streptomyces sp. NPDC087425]|uniref:tyrosinase family oxidase copper chaperone n=1 Tax=Streptomyces sp. NPDC087425 TaxID=3365787 RepID=UPI00381E560B